MEIVGKNLVEDEGMLKRRICDLEKALKAVREVLSTTEDTLAKEVDYLKEMEVDIAEQTTSMLPKGRVIHKEGQSSLKRCFSMIQGGEMTSTKLNLKRCRTSEGLLQPCNNVDRLTSLPDKLLSRILSKLPTKDAAATQVLSKRIGRAFPGITSVDLDESPISHCIKRPHLVDRFPLFESFIDNVLRILSESKHSLTRFKLRLGGDVSCHRIDCPMTWHVCDEDCFPRLKPARLYRWISYPLAHHDLRELDLSYHGGVGSRCKLPPGVFACQSLEVLKLDSNIEIDEVIDREISVICLPNLKLLHLHSFIFTEDNFVRRLISGCPVLEDLSITRCLWMTSDRLIICSRTLRRLILDNTKDDEEHNSDLVLINAPNLQYLHYVDNLPQCFTISHFNALVEAHISITHVLQSDSFQISGQRQLVLLKALSEVQYLSLLQYSTELVYYIGELKDDQLPMFHNLRTLELGPLCVTRWDIVLFTMLHRSPMLETLILPEGLFEEVSVYLGSFHRDQEAAALELEGWRTQGVPSCFLTRLKRIELSRCFGFDRELDMIKFLLGKALVLEEFVIRLSKDFGSAIYLQFDAPNLEEVERTLKQLPRASNSCSITVQR